MRGRFEDMDRNNDGKLDKEEIEQMVQRRAPQGRQSGQPQQFNPQAIKERIMSSDTDGNGLISREELPEQMQRRFEQMDANGDGTVDESEVDEMLRNRPSQPNRQRGGQGRI